MTCTGPECGRLARTLGLCRSHYQQHFRGRPLTPLSTANPTAGQTATVTFVSLTDGTVRARLTIPDGSNIAMVELATACRHLADALESAS